MLNVYVGAYSYNNKNAIFGVYMHHDKGEHLNIIDLGETTKNNAELQAVKYALSAVAENVDGIDVHIKTLNAYTYSMFQVRDGDWVSVPKKNVEVVEAARDLIKKYKSFIVTLHRNEEYIIKLNAIQKKKRDVSDKI